MNDRYKKLYKGVFESKELKKAFSLEHEFDNTTASAAHNLKSKDSEIPLSNQILYEKLDYKTEFDSPNHGRSGNHTPGSVFQMGQQNQSLEQERLKKNPSIDVVPVSNSSALPSIHYPQQMGSMFKTPADHHGSSNIISSENL